MNNEKEHKRNAEWLRELRSEKGNMKQNDINITTEMIKDLEWEKSRTR